MPQVLPGAFDCSAEWTPPNRDPLLLKTEIPEVLFLEAELFYGYFYSTNVT